MIGKTSFPILLTIVAALILVYVTQTKITPENTTPQNPSQETTTQPLTESQPTQTVSSATAPPTPTNFTATFSIFTNGTKRIFTAAMYHNQSDVVYIQNPDPSIIHVTKSGTTWNDFFKTLPFSLTKDCLVTGTKQTFCSNETQKLRFYINNSEQPNALDLEIQPNDELRVVYGE